MSNRNYSDPEYKKARLATLKRDGFKCKMCGSKIKCQVHHIRKYSEAPTLKYSLSNLITLCKQHHKRMFATEESFAALCLSLINKNKMNIYNILKEDENEKI